MGDTEDMKEDGELESDSLSNDEMIYKKLDRPQLETKTINTTAQQFYNSETSSSDDGGKPNKFMKRLEKSPQCETSASRSKNGSLWKNMLQEETLMENLKTCDVSSSRKRKFERGAESYDYENHRVKHRDNELAVKFHKRRRTKISGTSSRSSSSSSASSFVHGKKNRRNKQLKKSKVLPDLSVTLESTHLDFGRDLAQKLEEEKADLIIRVVAVIGKEASLSLYKVTQKVEKNGGMLTMNKLRRRTPGGIFLFLLKTSDKIDENLKKEVFDSDKKSSAERKMSSEQSEAKDPPNSPANPEFIEINGKITDPEIVSQKILNFSKPQDESPHDVLDLDYDDMDTF